MRGPFISKKAVTKVQAIIIAVVIIVAAVAGVAIYYVTLPPVKPKGEVSLWIQLPDPVASTIKDLIKTSFNKEYPDITVTVENVPELRTKLLAAIPAGTGPDVFEWAHDWTGEFAEGGYIVPIDDLVTPELLGKFFESAVKAGKWKGKLYALPIAAETVALNYNKDLLGDRPLPKTTDELISLMAEFKGKGYYGISYPINPYFVSCWVHAFGGLYWSDETRTLGVNSPGTKNAIKWLIEKFKPYMSEDISWDPQVALFTDKKSPFNINGPWIIGTWKDAKINFGIITLPEISEIKQMPKPFTGVKVIWMSKNVRYKEAAITFMEWYTTNRDHILTRATKFGYIPVLKEALDWPEIKGDPIIMEFSKQVELGIPMPVGPEMRFVWDEFDVALGSSWTGIKTVDEAFDEAQTRIEEKIKGM